MISHKSDHLDVDNSGSSNGEAGLWVAIVQFTPRMSLLRVKNSWIRESNDPKRKIYGSAGESAAQVSLKIIVGKTCRVFMPYDS